VSVIAAQNSAFPRLSEEQVDEVLGLLKGADSVELKLTVPDADRVSTVKALSMDSLDAQIRQVAFFDTPDLRLDQHGLVVRVRRIQRKPGDSVVKLRPVVPDELSGSLRKAPGFGVEVDAMPGGFVCSATMKAAVDDTRLTQVMGGGRPLRKVFGKEQRRFFASHAPEDVSLDDLVMLGPIHVLKLKFAPADFDRRMVAELWHYPDGARILELSTKCLPDEALDVTASARSFLGAHGVDLSAPQQTKTRTALEFFAGQLADTWP
jgi:hypothetical protein